MQLRTFKIQSLSIFNRSIRLGSISSKRKSMQKRRKQRSSIKISGKREIEKSYTLNLIRQMKK
jgi:hypothetical protein